VINGMLVEVNVMSPGGLVDINRSSKVKVQEKLIDFLESNVAARNNALERKTKLKNSIVDA
jgi:glutathione synthase